MKKKLQNLSLTTALALTLTGLSFGCGGAGDSAGDAEAAVPYPLKICVVSDEELGSMGDPIVIVHEGQEVKFCCKECVQEFQDNPDEYMLKIMTAETVAKP